MIQATKEAIRIPFPFPERPLLRYSRRSHRLYGRMVDLTSGNWWLELEANVAKVCVKMSDEHTLASIDSLLFQIGQFVFLTACLVVHLLKCRIVMFYSHLKVTLVLLFIICNVINKQMLVQLTLLTVLIGKSNFIYKAIFAIYSSSKQGAFD